MAYGGRRSGPALRFRRKPAPKSACGGHCHVSSTPERVSRSVNYFVTFLPCVCVSYIIHLASGTQLLQRERITYVHTYKHIVLFVTGRFFTQIDFWRNEKGFCLLCCYLENTGQFRRVPKPVQYINHLRGLSTCGYQFLHNHLSQAMLISVST